MAAVNTVELPIGIDEDCTACSDRLREGLLRHRGIAAITPAEGRQALRVDYDPDLCSLGCLGEAAAELRIDVGAGFEHEVLRVAGMDCYDCAQTIERAVTRMPGVSYVSVNFPAARMRVEYRPETVALERVADRVQRLGYRVSTPEDAGGAAPATPPWWRRRDALTAVAAVLTLLALALDLAAGLDGAAIGLYGAAIVLGGWPIARSGVAALVATRRPDINLLMAIAVVGAAAIDAWLEGALVVVLFAVGEALEGRAVERARRELAGLVSLAPEFARVRRPHADADADGDYEEVEVAIAELRVGDLAVVRPGERIPADGIATEGASAVDQAPITGESTPVDKAPGDPLFAGTLNGQGLLVVEVGAAPGDSTLDKIARLVAEAQARKSPSERWVDRFALVYTPLVILAAVLVAIVPPVAFGAEFADAFYSALALLILACPCALVISTPVSIVSALARASAAGVLVKGGAHLEQAAAIEAVAFDKTGTLTAGRPRLVDVEAFDGDADGLLVLAASLEQGSEHPLAKAIVGAARDRGLRLSTTADFEALTGLGARGTVDGARVMVGNARLFSAEDVLDERSGELLARLRDAGRTAVLVTRDDVAVGALALADTPRPEAAEAVAQLHRLGIRRTVMLTGDNQATAAAVAAELGIDEVRAELLPGDKAAVIGELGPGIAMVGDGVNDAPALAAADLGLAMGSAGSDTAIEVADVALMGDDPRKVAGLIGLARWTKAIVRQNIAFSLGTKLIAVVVLAAGALPLWAAVATDVGASLIVVANGLRLLRRAPSGRLRSAPLLAAAPTRGEPSAQAETQPAGCCDSC